MNCIRLQSFITHANIHPFTHTHTFRHWWKRLGDQCLAQGHFDTLSLSLWRGRGLKQEPSSYCDHFTSSAKPPFRHAALAGEHLAAFRQILFRSWWRPWRAPVCWWRLKQVKWEWLLGLHSSASVSAGCLKRKLVNLLHPCHCSVYSLLLCPQVSNTK